MLPAGYASGRGRPPRIRTIPQAPTPAMTRTATATTSQTAVLVPPSLDATVAAAAGVPEFETAAVVRPPEPLAPLLALALPLLDPG